MFDRPNFGLCDSKEACNTFFFQSEFDDVEAKAT